MHSEFFVSFDNFRVALLWASFRLFRRRNNYHCWRYLIVLDFITASFLTGKYCITDGNTKAANLCTRSKGGLYVTWFYHKCNELLAKKHSPLSFALKAFACIKRDYRYTRRVFISRRIFLPNFTTLKYAYIYTELILFIDLYIINFNGSTLACEVIT